jgi:hypothetical protein
LEHRSWWLDIKIVFLTFVNIVFGKKFWFAEKKSTNTKMLW